MRGRWYVGVMVLIAIICGLWMGKNAQAQKPYESIVVVSPGTTAGEPVLFLVDLRNGVMCVYSLQGNFLRFIAKRTFSRDFMAKDFHTR